MKNIIKVIITILILVSPVFSQITTDSYTVQSIDSLVGDVILNNGTVAIPSLRFANDPDVGLMYGSGMIGLSVGGSTIMYFRSTGLWVESSYQIYGQIEYKAAIFDLLDFSTVTPDTIWSWKNTFGGTVVIDSIEVLSTTDDQDLVVVECDELGGNVELVESITVTTDPTGNEKFYNTIINSIDHAAFENKHRIGFVRSTIASIEIIPTIYFHYNKVVR